MIAFVVAYAHHQVMGNAGGLPWHLPNDLKFVKKVTTGHTIVMGRKTYESIGRPLPNRRNIVLTSQPDFQADGIEVIHSKSDILELEGDLYILGGATLYEMLMPDVDTLYITEIDAEVEGDTFFPAWDKSAFHKVYEEPGVLDERNTLPHTFYVYERNR